MMALTKLCRGFRLTPTLGDCAHAEPVDSTTINAAGAAHRLNIVLSFSGRKNFVTGYSCGIGAGSTVVLCYTITMASIDLVCFLFKPAPSFRGTKPLPSKSRHNHQKCVRDAVAAAERICSDKHSRLTPLRRRVLELVWSSHAPIGAYELLELMAKDGSRPAPPTIYRALDFLKTQGLVHRIETLNAFVGCAHPEAPHDAQYLICEACGMAVELEIDGLAGHIEKAAAREGFSVGAQTIEVQGRCGDCTGAGS